MQKIRLKIPYHRYREVVKTKIFHLVMTSMTMFILNQNSTDFIVCQKSKPKSA